MQKGGRYEIERRVLTHYQPYLSAHSLIYSIYNIQKLFYENSGYLFNDVENKQNQPLECLNIASQEELKHIGYICKSYFKNTSRGIIS